MSVYDFGGIYDYLDDIHFPKSGGAKFPPNTSQPWYYYLLRQTPTYFSYLGGVWGPGWAARANLPIIKILEADTRHPVPTEPVGATSLEDAADTYVRRWDQNPLNPLDVSFFGRMNYADPFFWKVSGKTFPKWASSLGGLARSRPNDPNPPIGPYIEKATTSYFERWNSDSSAYNAVANGIPPDGGGWNPKASHSFAVPYPNPTAWQGGTFSGLQKLIATGKGWFGPIPTSSWTRFAILFTQSYAFTYGFGHLDPAEWDLSTWPPRRTSIQQKDGGSKNRPSIITGNYNGVDPFITFIDHQFPLL